MHTIYFAGVAKIVSIGVDCVSVFLQILRADPTDKR